MNIQLRRLKYERPLLYPKQRAAIFDPHRFSLIEATTKAGKTAGCIAWIVEQALAGRAGWNYWWVAPVSDQALIAFRRCMRAIPKDMFTANISLKTITLVNGTIIWFKSGDKPNSLYGEDVYGAVLDEASRMKEDAWIAVRSTITFTRAKIRIIGNVRGRKNWFFRMARQAERDQLLDKPNREMGYHKIVADDAVSAGVLDAKEIQDAREQLPEQAFRELYLAEPSDDGGNPFGLKHITACVRPMSDKQPRWWGWDFAKKVDYTVGIALDEDFAVCRFERWQGVPWGESIYRVCQLTGNTPALGDSTGVGDPIVEAIQSKLSDQTFIGYQFTTASKQKLMEGLAMAIQNGTMWYPEGAIVQELEQFEFELTRTGVRYSAPEGFHDDCVCALALANMCRLTAVPTMAQAMAGNADAILQQISRMPRRFTY
jgi:hypothetical protein